MCGVREFFWCKVLEFVVVVEIPAAFFVKVAGSLSVKGEDVVRFKGVRRSVDAWGGFDGSDGYNGLGIGAGASMCGREI